MKALRSTQENKKITTRVEETTQPQPATGEVLIRAEFSGLNYKDALGVTGQGAIFKKFPLTGGIDVAGTVEESQDPRFKKGDPVLINGGGLGETHDGGYAQFVVEKAENVIHRPKTLSAENAMTYGTAGFTAALAFERMLHNGQTPEKGPILVTGASGGVGQFAIHFFANQGFEVHALTSKADLASRLRSLGAAKIILTSEFELGSRPLEGVKFGGVVDNIGGTTLSRALAHVNLWGNVGSIGLADSHELHASVMPFILRGVSLLGVSSNNTPHELRQKIWNRLGADLKPRDLDSFITDTIPLEDTLAHAQQMLQRKTHGRILIRL